MDSVIVPTIIDEDPGLFGHAADRFSDGLETFGEFATARDNFLSFVHVVGRDERGKRLRMNALTRIRCSNLSHCYSIGLGRSVASRKHYYEVGPPGTGKSSIARLFNLWCMGIDPLMHQVCASADKKIATDSVGLCRDIIEAEHTNYRQVFNEIRPDFERKIDKRQRGSRGWERDAFFLHGVGGAQSPDPAMMALAAIPVGEARRIGLLLADDIMTREIAGSPIRRDRLVTAFFQTFIEGRLSEGGWCHGYQNCWNKLDLGHKLIRDSRFFSNWIGVSVDCEMITLRLYNPPEDLPLLLDPESFEAEPCQPGDEADYEFLIPLLGGRWTPENMRELQAAMVDDDGNRFQQTYRNQAQSDTDYMFPHFTTRTREEKTIAQLLRIDEAGGLPVIPEDQQYRFVIGAGVDISGGRRPGDAVSFRAMDQQLHRYMLEVHLGKFGISGIIELLQSAYMRGIKFDWVFVENNGVQEMIVDHIRALAREAEYDWMYRIESFTTTRQKVDPQFGLPKMDAQFETGEEIWPSGEAARPGPQGKLWRRMEAEYAGCPRILEPGRTPDLLMSGWFADGAINKGSLLTGQIRPTTTRRERKFGNY